MHLYKMHWYIAIGTLSLFVWLRKKKKVDKETQTEITCDILSEMLKHMLKLEDDQMDVDTDSGISMDIDTISDTLNFDENYLNETRSISFSESI